MPAAVIERSGVTPLASSPASSAQLRRARGARLAALDARLLRRRVSLLVSGPLARRERPASRPRPGVPISRRSSSRSLTAPAWLVSDVGTAYHLAQMIGALAMSLAAVPVYWLARRLGLTTGVALGIAALSLALPDLIYASWIVAEPFAYPLALAAVAAAVAALERPSKRSQLAFVALCGPGRVRAHPVRRPARVLPRRHPPRRPA